MISRESGVIYHYIHICRILHKWGFKQKVPRKRHINTASVKEKKDFKKEKKILDTLTDEFTAVSLDESFFFYDSLVRRVWIYKDNRPVVNVTGSHKHLCLFGAVGLDGKQLLVDEPFYYAVKWR